MLLSRLSKPRVCGQSSIYGPESSLPARTRTCEAIRGTTHGPPAPSKFVLVQTHRSR